MTINLKKSLILSFKVIVVALCLYLVVSKLDIDKLKVYFFSISLPTAVLAGLLMLITQIITSFRVKYYLSKANVNNKYIYYILLLFFTIKK